jgi:hypothetical protein
MATFEGLSLNDISKMEVGELYMYFHDNYAREGIPFCLSEKYDNEGTTIFIAERLDGKADRIAFQSDLEQENMNKQISALYLLSELKDANERIR